MARIEVEALAKFYGLTKATRFINLLEVAGISTTRARDRRAPFQRGRHRRRVASAAVRFRRGARPRRRRNLHARGQSPGRAAVNVRSRGTRCLSVLPLESTTSRIHYRRDVLPLRKIISDETLLRYNAMQIDVFALLAEARQRIAPTIAAIDAERDFWLAEQRSRRRRDRRRRSRSAARSAEPASRHACGASGTATTMKNAKNVAPHVCRDDDSAQRSPAPARSAAGRRPPPSRKRRRRRTNTMQPPLFPASGPRLSAGGDAQRLDAALAHERRLEGISSRRRAGRARNRARHDGASVGL